MADSQKGSKKKRKAVIPSGIPSKKKKTVIDEETTNKTNQNDESTSNDNFKSQIMEKFEEELKCNICTEILIRPMVLNCSHMFCEYCITKWKKQQDRCPICREKVESLIRVLALDVFIEKALEVLAPDENKAREELINQREQTKSQKPRRSQRLRNRRQSVSVSTAHEALEESSFHLRALIDEVLHLANHFTYD